MKEASPTDAKVADQMRSSPVLPGLYEQRTTGTPTTYLPRFSDRPLSFLAFFSSG